MKNSSHARITLKNKKNVLIVAVKPVPSFRFILNFLLFLSLSLEKQICIRQITTFYSICTLLSGIVLDVCVCVRVDDHHAQNQKHFILN